MEILKIYRPWCIVIYILPVFCLGQITLQARFHLKLKFVLLRRNITEYTGLWPHARLPINPFKNHLLYKDAWRFKPFLPARMGGGGAIGRDLIVVPIDFKPFLEQSFFQITVHELVHIVLGRGYPGLAIPRWFHEGVAMTLAGELTLQENVGCRKPFSPPASCPSLQLIP